MATCASWQAPYGDSGFQGNTVAEVCAKVTQAYWSNEATWSVNGEQCTVVDGEASNTYNYPKQCDAPTSTPSEGNTINCTSACTVSLTISPPELDADRVQADLVLWGMCLGFLVTIWAGKQIINFFRTGRYES
ncbi:hypothetical protein RD110_10280 [Rhodoferax koreense]|uniref:Uncharacterized protein n=1 Tax=Rhodoferax koreensis TaxID=1842727 RepID=A0A1P8JUS9_9BURK|nr:hypothetical protein [Rhodoferax koreense]APW37526.1 hypothetical protein RD110_10280 [Rhodoferax koreense]